MNKTYLFSYFGNKDRECKEIFDFLEKNIKFENYDTIIEPFGGSFAFIRHLINNKKITKKYIVNDNDKILIDTYNNYKNNEDNEKNLNILKDYYNDVYNNKEKYNKLKKESKKNINAFLLMNMYFNIRVGIFPEKKSIIIDNCYSRIKNFVIYKDVEFISFDAFDIIEKYKDDEKAFLFLDPPFLLECNSYYIKTCIEKIINVLKNFYNYKCTILMTLGGHILIESLLNFLNIKPCFITKLKYRGSKEAQNIYMFNKN